MVTATIIAGVIALRKRYIKAPFVEKSFDELDREDLRSMVRTYNRIPLKELFEYYGIDGNAYKEKMKSFGMSVSHYEHREADIPYRTAYKPTGNPNPFIREEIKLSRVEMIAVRMFRGFTEKEMAERLGKATRYIDRAERYDDDYSRRLRYLYVQNLKITPSEIRRIRLALSGETDRVEVDRSIPPVIRDEVYKKYESKCGDCNSTDNLHIHHKLKYSDGGKHELNNLELLCSECHAERHKNDREYRLLKSIAERAMQLS